MPNVLAQLALLLLLPAILLLFLRFRPSLAVGVSLLGSAILLPTGIGPDPPMMPPLGREHLTSLVVLFAVLIFQPGSLGRLRRSPGFAALGLAAFIIPYLTALANGDALIHRPAMDLYDALIISQTRAFTFSIPFLLGLTLVRRRQDIRQLLVLLCVAGLAYSFLALFEVRMSPKLHRIVYGYDAHEAWSQAKRFGGWRPMVFMDHGLALARFMLTTLLATAVLHRAGIRLLGLRLAPAVGYLAAVLVLCKSLGSIVYGVFALPAVLILRSRRLAVLALALGLIVITYPITRALQLFPTDTLVSLASEIQETRAESLRYRFYNEDLLLDHALERPLFGWGGWNRNRVYDIETGEDLSTTDGYWIIIFGKEGLAGFATHFGLLIFPALLVARRSQRIRGERARLELVGLALIVTVNAVDLIPNAFIMTFMIYCSGGLIGALPAYMALRQTARSEYSAHSPVDGAAPNPDPRDACDGRSPGHPDAVASPRLASLLEHGSGRRGGASR